MHCNGEGVILSVSLDWVPLHALIFSEPVEGKLYFCGRVTGLHGFMEKKHPYSKISSSRIVIYANSSCNSKVDRPIISTIPFNSKE